MENEKFPLAKIFTVTISLLLLTAVLGAFSGIAFAQSSLCDNGELKPSPSSSTLPVILVHGYNEGSGIWIPWELALEASGIQYCSVTFHPDDFCGRASHDATELSKIVQNVKDMTQQNQVNIVAHSKGGLDARLYLSRSNTSDVANLIMIGTPNAGSPVADYTEAYNLNPFCPAVRDLTTNAPVNDAAENNSTRYFTIAGMCLPFLEYGGITLIPEFNDGLVSVSSVESQSYFHSLGHSPNCHVFLLGNYEYLLAYGVLSGKE
jgi:triacylglycerol lipase